MTPDQRKNLMIRSVSALAALGILVSTYLFFEKVGVAILAILLEVMVIKEGVNLVDWAPLSKRFKLGIGIMIYVLFLLILFLEPFRFQILVGAIALGLAFSIQMKSGDSLERLQIIQSKALMLSIYLALFPALLIDLLFKYQGSLWFISLMAMVFAGDIGAYAFGITMGKRHVLPLISPKKTWAGAVGGFFATILTAFAIHQLAALKIPIFGWLVMSALISFVAQSGDFFESLLKRVANVKDSGTIMPGHGGILDRIDGLIFAAPIMSIAISYFDRWI